MLLNDFRVKRSSCLLFEEISTRWKMVAYKSCLWNVSNVWFFFYLLSTWRPNVWLFQNILVAFFFVVCLCFGQRLSKWFPKWNRSHMYNNLTFNLMWTSVPYQSKGQSCEQNLPCFQPKLLSKYLIFDKEYSYQIAWIFLFNISV